MPNEPVCLPHPASQLSQALALPFFRNSHGGEGGVSFSCKGKTCIFVSQTQVFPSSAFEAVIISNLKFIHEQSVT